MKDSNITIAGATRDQTQTIGNILVDSALSQGFAVFAWQEDEPKRFGGKNYHHIRISDMPADEPFSRADIIADIESTGQWAVTPLEDIDSSGMKRFSTKDQIQNYPSAGGIFASAELLGAVSAVTGIDFYTLIHHLARHFAHIDKEAISGAQSAAEKGYAIAGGKGVQKTRLPIRKQRYIAFTGNDAITMGAAYAGCQFVYSFPMASSNRLVTFLEKQKSLFGSLARQDEYAIAPSYSAKKNTQQRAGFAWTAEEIFLPCLADTPVVIVLGQQTKKACRKRSRTNTDDYLFGICAGKGKTAKMVLTPQNAEDAFYKTILSFQLADKHHAPVIILADPMVSESLFSVGEIDPRRQSLFAYLSDPEKIKCRVADKNVF